MANESVIKLFEGKQVRIVWDEEQEKYYFSVVDVVGVLTDSVNPRDYIKKMLPNISAEIIEKQKSLQPGTCVAFGKAFKIPMIIKMSMPNPEPYSGNADIVKSWQVKQGN